MKGYAVLACLLFLLAMGCKKDSPVKSNLAVTYSNGPTDSLKLNQVSILASHNSYHHRTDSAVLAFLYTLDSLQLLPSAYDPHQLDYDDLPISQQLEDYNIRGLELDVWNDPQGGQFYNRRAYTLMNQSNKVETHIPALLNPGFKLLHIPDFDFNSDSYTFVEALENIKAWSDANPNHLPLFINVETEVSAPGDELSILGELTKAVPFDAAAADELDAEVKAVFGQDLKGVITPDMVRGNYTTLEDAVLAGNWPQLAKARGKVIFIVNADGSSGDVYMAGHPSLQGRAMFVYTNPGTPEAAFVLLNNPVSSLNQIKHRVAQGYIVRTMSDDQGSEQVHTGDYTQMNAAFDSWAQIVSTDYYRPDPRAGTGNWTDYQVHLPGGNVARIDSAAAPGLLNLGTIKE
ncbi:MAG TPA: Ca2+-dependent phosphoinositide-specific phospholipase C [Chitinophagales bacterium]|nr:Ca2+-dependent phosphoinositide-specific phospholipase C [Chitinophagales bacterium]